ncbi:response regulator transcription factor [Kribbella sp. VKM Ac-2566]|uniref:response regulator transcription factor n=1 Tax=Kribbella sp. VKM Ac-2566 TaxID=2512218 RepID=UPI0010628F85|nr:response regulator transcription factor [Kribbella sp. VKM Ac-2566]TDW91910.1 DNA-binding response OmpR family regulator [Kribbella sp. VKM Ac-2566]
MSRVLVIEDDADVGLALGVLLRRSGYEVDHVEDGRAGLRAVHSLRPDLLVLDIGLRGMDGWQVLERVRDISDLPILILSGHGQEADKVRGLRAGADDYLTKPFGSNELVARLEALLRRTAQPTWAIEVYDDGRLRIDPQQRSVSLDGRDVRLTPTEFRLLAVLVRHGGSILNPAQLLAQVWDDPSGLGLERVKFAVLRLRRKLESPDAPAARIESVRGFGYRFRGSA